MLFVYCICLAGKKEKYLTFSERLIASYSYLVNAVHLTWASNFDQSSISCLQDSL